ncbi:T9SS type A sorting domain-containing protein [Flavobacteriaceae bacterium XHP0103]|uniref:T9SS type A sorting domain-containing protein n=1 Tax=Marixanthotalea marina TaxID=2844359 RepID=UPI002989B599|nr:T9SS type A sorting domain-containing protein [Marixanthotalea marina]MBU3822094.1 T9SS type A sorting domain-containing protein [Marixanthotalea marina]
MRKNYLIITFLFLAFIITQQGFAQSSVTGAPNSQQSQNIEGLSIYPNPVTEGSQVIYITSKKNFTKNIEIYNVLGKQIYTTVLTGKELNISSLSTGVYILKITENKISETRKLVIK